MQGVALFELFELFMPISCIQCVNRLKSLHGVTSWSAAFESI